MIAIQTLSSDLFLIQPCSIYKMSIYLYIYLFVCLSRSPSAFRSWAGLLVCNAFWWGKYIYRTNFTIFKLRLSIILCLNIPFDSKFNVDIASRMHNLQFMYSFWDIWVLVESVNIWIGQYWRQDHQLMAYKNWSISKHFKRSYK
jgi:hypothetical protein